MDKPGLRPLWKPLMNIKIFPTDSLAFLAKILDPAYSPATEQEKHMKQIVNYYETIIRCMPGNVYWFDKEACAVGCNQNVLDMFGLSSIELFRGLTFEEMGKIGHWTPQTTQSFKHDSLEVITTGHAKTDVEEPPIRHHDGHLMHFLTHRVPIKDEEQQVIGMVGISIDITQRKELESDLEQAKTQAIAASQAKTEFLENMRHDIRTPLSGIVGFAEILKTESKEAHTKEYAENLIASSFALLDLMDEVLEAIRVSSGEIPLLKQKFDLRVLLKHVIDLNLAKSKEKQLQLNFLVDEEVPRYVVGDKIRLHRIVLELVSNALTFTNKGHVTLTVSLAKKQDRLLILRIKVCDSGIGIPTEKQKDIYVQFKRLTPSYQGIYKGAGLGLYIVRQFLDELGAEISVESEVGVGTSFTCVIPLQAPLLDDESGVDNDMPVPMKSFFSAKEPIDEHTHQVASSNKQSRILVVEDNSIAQKVAKTILSSMNCDVDLAANGRDALHQINTNHYDLIFMDIGLGEGADGYEITQEIRSNEQQDAHIPIVALTAHGGDENKQRCVEAGMDAVLSKPMTKTHATNILSAFLRREKTAPEPVNKAKLDLPDTEDELFQLEQYPLLETTQTIKNLGDKAILIDLLKSLVQKSLPEDFNAMKMAFQNQDYEQVEKLAHKIKGGAVYVGTMRMKYACQYLERYWKAGQIALFGQLYKQAVVVIEETLAYVKEWLQSAD